MGHYAFSEEWHHVGVIFSLGQQSNYKLYLGDFPWMVIL